MGDIQNKYVENVYFTAKDFVTGAEEFYEVHYRDIDKISPHIFDVEAKNIVLPDLVLLFASLLEQFSVPSFIQRKPSFPSHPKLQPIISIDEQSQREIEVQDEPKTSSMSEEQKFLPTNNSEPNKKVINGSTEVCPDGNLDSGENEEESDTNKKGNISSKDTIFHDKNKQENMRYSDECKEQNIFSRQSDNYEINRQEQLSFFDCQKKIDSYMPLNGVSLDEPGQSPKKSDNLDIRQKICCLDCSYESYSDVHMKFHLKVAHPEVDQLDDSIAKYDENDDKTCSTIESKDEEGTRMIQGVKVDETIVNSEEGSNMSFISKLKRAAEIDKMDNANKGSLTQDHQSYSSLEQMQHHELNIDKDRKDYLKLDDGLISVPSGLGPINSPYNSEVISNTVGCWADKQQSMNDKAIDNRSTAFMESACNNVSADGSFRNNGDEKSDIPADLKINPSFIEGIGVENIKGPLTIKTKEDGKAEVITDPSEDPNKNSFLDSGYIKSEQFPSENRDLQESNLTDIDSSNMKCCAECSYKTTKRFLLKKHILSVHQSVKNHSCVHCDYKSYEKGAMRRHVRTVHKTEVINDENTDDLVNTFNGRINDDTLPEDMYNENQQIEDTDKNNDDYEDGKGMVMINKSDINSLYHGSAHQSLFSNAPNSAIRNFPGCQDSKTFTDNNQESNLSCNNPKNQTKDDVNNFAGNDAKNGNETKACLMIEKNQMEHKTKDDNPKRDERDTRQLPDRVDDHSDEASHSFTSNSSSFSDLTSKHLKSFEANELKDIFKEERKTPTFNISDRSKEESRDSNLSHEQHNLAKPKNDYLNITTSSASLSLFQEHTNKESTNVCNTNYSLQNFPTNFISTTTSASMPIHPSQNSNQDDERHKDFKTLDLRDKFPNESLSEGSHKLGALNDAQSVGHLGKSEPMHFEDNKRHSLYLNQHRPEPYFNHGGTYMPYNKDISHSNQSNTGQDKIGPIENMAINLFTPRFPGDDGRPMYYQEMDTVTRNFNPQLPNVYDRNFKNEAPRPLFQLPLQSLNHGFQPQLFNANLNQGDLQSAYRTKRAPVVCGDCGADMPGKRELQRHNKKFHKPQYTRNRSKGVVDDTMGGGTFPSMPLPGNQTTSNLQSREVGSNQGNQISELNQPLKTSIAGKEMNERECPHCTYESPNSSYLQQHIKAVHMKIKDLPCPYETCSYKAAMKHHLKHHIKAVHEKIKDYPCLKCNYSASQKINLLHHMRVHDEQQQTSQDSSTNKSNKDEKPGVPNQDHYDPYANFGPPSSSIQLQQSSAGQWVRDA